MELSYCSCHLSSSSSLEKLDPKYGMFHCCSDAVPLSMSNSPSSHLHCSYDLPARIVFFTLWQVVWYDADVWWLLMKYSVLPNGSSTYALFIYSNCSFTQKCKSYLAVLLLTAGNRSPPSVQFPHLSFQFTTKRKQQHCSQLHILARSLYDTMLSSFFSISPKIDIAAQIGHQHFTAFSGPSSLTVHKWKSKWSVASIMLSVRGSQQMGVWNLDCR